VSDAIGPIAALARRFTIDWLNLADPAVPPTIMTPAYRVHIGDTELDSLEDYSRATLGQLQQFPGLGLTVHELLTDGAELALVFTEHGSSRKHEGRAAAWRGVALFRIENGLLAENWTQEDYYSRRRQLADGVADPIPAPAPSPWTTAPQVANAEAEQVASEWLRRPRFESVVIDDGAPAVIEPHSVEVARVFSAGRQVAIAATWTGRYAGGIDGVEGPGGDVRLGVCGVLDVEGGAVAGGRIVTDRLGLRRALLGRAPRG
jgi:predicted ester cyclase